MYDHKVLPDMSGMPSDSTISLARFDPVKEMDILRAVLLRDALISLLAEQRRNFMSGGVLCVKTVSCALLETREASLEVIEAIKRWRLTLVKPEPFNVRGKNYAVEMTTDVGFLATGLTPLKEAFGLELGTGNPFALPCAPSLVVARKGGSGNRRADKGDSGDVHVAKGKGKDVTANRAAGGGGVAAHGSRCTRVRGSAEKNAKEEVLVVRSATSDIKAPGGSDTLLVDSRSSSGDTSTPPAVSATAAAEENQAGVEGSGGTPKGGDVAETEVEVRRCSRSDEEDCPKRNYFDQQGGVEGGRDGGSAASIHEVLRELGDLDDEQRARLARAQRFLEEEVARQDSAYPRDCSTTY